MRKCIDCQTKISQRHNSIRCRSCAGKINVKNRRSYKGKNNPNFDNHILKERFAGEKNPNYKDGHTTYQHYCKDCGKKIHREAQRCKSCCGKLRINKLAPAYRNGKTNNNTCIDCGIHISYQATRCKSCAYKNDYKMGVRKSKRGKENNMYGHLLTPKFMKYKKIMFRSSWEVKYARYLDKHRIKWLYESKTFDLGNCTYRPDFYLPDLDTYIEIKGYLSLESNKKIKLFRKLYSRIKFKLYRQNHLKRMRVLI